MRGGSILPHHKSLEYKLYTTNYHHNDHHNNHNYHKLSLHTGELVGGFNHLEKYESQWEGLSPYIAENKNIWNHQPDNKRKHQINTMRFPKNKNKKLRHREGGEADHGWRDGGQSGRHGLPKTRKWRLHGGNGGLAIAKFYHPIWL